MLSSHKSKGFFIELNEHVVRIVRTSSPVVPFVVEEMRECPAGNPAAVEEVIRQMQPKKPASGYLHATVGVYPARRLVRRHSIEVKRAKEPEYFAELCSQQFRIEQDKYTLAVINATDGASAELAKTNQKDLLFCGLPAEDVDALQARLLEEGIYPERLELGSVAMLGALADYLAHTKAKAPVLLLELEAQATHSFIVSGAGVEASRLIPQGLDAMVPVVQKELGLKDEESAKKLFYSNTFDFTGMGPLLTRRLLKELQSSIGFYEVQTGQSVGQVMITQLSQKLGWLENVVSGALGIPNLKMDPVAWLQARQITLPDALVATAQEPRWTGVLGLMTQYDAVPAKEEK